MKTLTKQQIFDRVATHLVRQREKSIRQGICQYRGDGGLKCAVGVLIPDYRYREYMEQLTPGDRELNQVTRCGDDACQLLQQLQSTHDARTVPSWPAALVDIAEQHGLDLDVLDRELRRLERDA